MSPRSEFLETLTAPRSVAIVGASQDGDRIGGRPIKQMLKQGFRGDIYPVNPKRPTIQGLPAFASVADIPVDFDLVIIAVRRDLVFSALAQAAEKQIKVAIVFSSGFAESDSSGAEQQQAMVEFARERGIRLLGPNCIGVMNASNGFCASFTSAVEQISVMPGRLGVISQSGAYGGHLLFMAQKYGLGTTYWLTTGNECDVNVGELIGHMAEDDDVDTIAVYAESFKDIDGLVRSLEAARAARKPVLILKVGCSGSGAAAARSHTAALAGDDAVCDAVLRQFGAYRVESTEELLDVARACRPRVFPTGRRLGLVTISGGAGVIMADAAEERGLDVADMPDAAQGQLRTIVPFASTRNPVDVTAQFINEPQIIPSFLSTMANAGNYDGLVGFWTFAAGNPNLSSVLLQAVRDTEFPNKNCAFIQSLVAPDDIVRGYEDAGFPCFEDPTRAVNAMAALMQLGTSFAELAESIPRVPAVAALPSGPLGERETKAILRKFGLPMVEDFLATSAEEAAAAAERAGTPLAMKVCSADIAHKSDIGGIRLGVVGKDCAYAAFAEIAANVAKNAPTASFNGVLISPMIDDGVECIVGAQNDPVFGPIVMAGLGGVFAEVLKDVSFRRAPISPAVAMSMLEELKGVAMLKGVRGTPPADLPALAQVISDLSVFAKAHEDTVESVEINPLSARAEGCVALDALIVRQ